MLVTFMRAVADAGGSHVKGFRDPTARVFLNARLRERFAKMERELREKPGSFSVKAAMAGADMIALRTVTIDAALRDAIAGGARQLVILGAGLDGRAWRIDELAGVRVFEVDHPATQAEKRSHRAELPEPVAAVTFVPVNFERDSLDDALSAAGHDATVQTCWIWEGVVMYLTREAMLATLATVARRSTAGSTLIINYHTKGRRRLMGWILRLIGEPQLSTWSPGEMAADLRGAGFRVLDDSGFTEWSARFAPDAIQRPAGRIMRIVVAERS